MGYIKTRKAGEIWITKRWKTIIRREKWKAKTLNGKTGFRKICEFS